MTAKLRLALCALALVSGCKQGVGDHCELNDDCDTGICSPTQMVCESPETIVVDASVDLDALRIPDASLLPDGGGGAPPPDAPAVPDAPIVLDAPPDVDASL